MSTMKTSLLVLLFAVGCSREKVPVNHSGVGFVRSIDWSKRTFIHETDDGFTREFSFCNGVIPVWEGEHVDLQFRWLPWFDGHGNCDEFLGSKHLPPDWIVKP